MKSSFAPVVRTAAPAVVNVSARGVQQVHGAEKRETASVLDNLADVLEKAGQAAEATRLRGEAARIRRKLCDEC